MVEAYSAMPFAPVRRRLAGTGKPMPLGMGPEMRDLYRDFPTSNPGQFRRIMRHATWRTAERDEGLCREGAVPEG